MGVNISTNIPDVIKKIEGFSKRLDEEMIVALVEAGNKIINVAKDTHTYRNRTSNLEASTGFGVVVKGKLIGYGGFDTSVMGGNKGLEVLESKVSEVDPNSYAIIVIAGMDYATYVERCGYVVLDDARFKGEGILSNLLDKIKIVI